MLPIVKNKTARAAIIASSIGNFVEIFDFTIYATILPILSQKFFPVENPFISMLMTLVVFAVGFVLRPFGSIIFGFIGDRYGRKNSLTCSIMIMSCSTVLIGILPTYDTIGLYATICLILCRLAQGLSMGGEFATSSIYLIEHLTKKEGLACGITTSFAIFGALIANIIGHFIMSGNVPEYIWRLPFITGGILAAIGVYLRFLIEETSEYKQLILNNSISKFPIKEILKEHTYKFILTIGICAYAGAISYTILAYLPLHLATVLGFEYAYAIKINYFGLLSYGLSSIFFGLLTDKFTPAKILFYSSLIGTLLTVPIFFYINSSNAFILPLLEVLLGLLAGSYCNAQLPLVSKLFPTAVRCSAIAFAHSIGISLVGGTFPLISFFLINKFNNHLMSGIYLSFCSLIGFIFGILVIKKLHSIQNINSTSNKTNPISPYVAY